MILNDNGSYYYCLKCWNCLPGPQISNLFCNCYSATRLSFSIDRGWCFPMEQALKSLFELCASEIVHKQVHRRTHIRTNLWNCCEKIEGICELSPSSQPWLKRWNNSKDNDGNGKHEELDGQKDEHFGDADLFAGQTGRRLAAPTNAMNESDSRDGGSYQHDNWREKTQTKKQTKKRSKHWSRLYSGNSNR